MTAMDVHYNVVMQRPSVMHAGTGLKIWQAFTYTFKDHTNTMLYFVISYRRLRPKRVGVQSSVQRYSYLIAHHKIAWIEHAQ